MKKITFLTLIVLALTVAACGAPANATPTPSPIPTVLADTTIVSDGRLEPIRFADIALSATGLVSKVLVKEGAQDKPGQVIARLVGPDTRTLEDAQMAAVHMATMTFARA